MFLVLKIQYGKVDIIDLYLTDAAKTESQNAAIKHVNYMTTREEFLWEINCLPLENYTAWLLFNIHL